MFWWKILNLNVLRIFLINYDKTIDRIRISKIDFYTDFGHKVIFKTGFYVNKLIDKNVSRVIEKGNKILRHRLSLDFWKWMYMIYVKNTIKTALLKTVLK